MARHFPRLGRRRGQPGLIPQSARSDAQSPSSAEAARAEAYSAHAEAYSAHAEVYSRPTAAPAPGMARTAIATSAALTRKLRPSKVRRALRRRWFEQRVWRLPLTPYPSLLTLGTRYGRWMVPGDLIGPDWTCWCVGAGGDVSFDLELLRRFGARVRSFDPDPEFARVARMESAGHPRYSFHEVAITATDGPLRMQRHHQSNSRSLSPAGLYESHEYVEVPGRSLESLRAELGDERIDLLKLDVEGAEYDLLATLDPAALGIRVLSVQLHHNGGVHAAHQLAARLAAQGYRPVAQIRGAVKITFLRESSS